MRQNSEDSARPPALPFDAPPGSSSPSAPSHSSDPEEPLLDDERWDLIKGCLPEAKPPRRRRGRKGGRPPLPPRLCFEALLRHLAGGRPWRGLPASFGSSRTIQRRLDLWLTQGSLQRAWRRYLETAPERERQAWGARLRTRRDSKLGLWYWELLGAARALSGGRAGQP
jgi:transposase